MFAKVMTITPQVAAEWLDTKNSRNRPVSQTTVDRFAQEMRRGNWQMNGQAIIFGKTGNLLNGQHRLKACIAANKSFETAVIYGIEDETFDTMDDGIKRSMPDVLAIRGEANPSLLSAGLRFLWLYAGGDIQTRDLRRSTIATKKVFEDTLVKHPGMRQSVKFYAMLKARNGGMLLGSGLAIGLHYLFALVDERKADEFFSQFQSGLGLAAGNPIALLRARLIAGRTASSKLTPAAQYYYTVTAWNAFCSEEPLKRLVYTDEAKLPEIENLPKKLLKDLL